METTGRYRSSKYRHPALPLDLGAVYITSGLHAWIDGDAEGNAALLNALRLHQAGVWSAGGLDEEDCAANDAALDSGARILTAWTITVGGDTRRVYVISEAVDGTGHRWCTTLLLASDY